MKVLLVSCLLFLFAGSAHAVQLSVAGELNYSKYFGGGALAQPKLGHGAGVFLDFRSFAVGFQLGAVYMKRITARDGGGLNTFPFVQLPLALRLWIGRKVVLSGGGYWAQGMGSFPSIGVRSYDYGAFGGVTFNFPIAILTAMFFDFRYLHGLADISSIKGDTTWRDVQCLVGFKFGR